MMAIWEKAIKPTLYDYGGEALVCSNSAGKNPDNFFYNICTEPKYGFREFHSTTWTIHFCQSGCRTRASMLGGCEGRNTRPI